MYWTPVPAGASEGIRFRCELCITRLLEYISRDSNLGLDFISLVIQDKKHSLLYVEGLTERWYADRVAWLAKKGYESNANS